MKNIRVAINGFGRIGRVLTRKIINHPSIELVAINDLTNSSTLAHLFKYDSIHGRYKGEVSANDFRIAIDGKWIKTYAEKNPAGLPWQADNIDVVVECTGHFKDRASAGIHLIAGAKKVIISAPADGDDIPSVCMGVNDSILKADDLIISNASCTTNNAAPMIQILDEICGIESGYITTVHSYTGDQRLHDAPHSDFRRARAAAVSMIPTSTGAAKAITKIFPHLNGKLGGAGVRVPVPDGSLTDITCIVNRPLSVAEINQNFKKAADGKLKGVLEYTDEPIVSIDIVGNPHSCIFDSQLTSVIGNMVKVVGWYDNEWGYTSRLVELIEKVGSMEA